MTLRYTWTLFFLECRIIISTVFVLYCWYKLRMLDSLLKPYLEGILSRRCKLKVQFSDFSLDIWRGECRVTNATLFHPPLEEDPRWAFEYMAFAESISLTFDPNKALYGYLTNDYKLLVLKYVTVQGIDLFVEGYEEVGKKTVLNLKLIGGEIPRFVRQRKPTQVELRVKAKEEERLRKQENAIACSTMKSAGAVHHVARNALLESVTGESVEPFRQTHLLEAETGPATRSAAPAVAPSSWGAAASFLRSSLTSKLQEWHSEVREHGIVHTVREKTSQALQATVSTVDAVYKSARQKIGSEVSARVDLLHEKLRGGEPIAFPHEFLIMADAITFIDIEVTLRHALPPALRQFEKRPLYLSVLTLADIRTASSILPTSPVSRPAPHSMTHTATGETSPSISSTQTMSHALPLGDAGGQMALGSQLPVSSAADRYHLPTTHRTPSPASVEQEDAAESLGMLDTELSRFDGGLLPCHLEGLPLSPVRVTRNSSGRRGDIGKETSKAYRHTQQPRTDEFSVRVEGVPVSSGAAGPPLLVGVETVGVERRHFSLTDQGHPSDESESCWTDVDSQPDTAPFGPEYDVDAILGFDFGTGLTNTASGDGCDADREYDVDTLLEIPPDPLSTTTDPQRHTSPASLAPISMVEWEECTVSDVAKRPADNASGSPSGSHPTESDSILATLARGEAEETDYEDRSNARRGVTMTLSRAGGVSGDGVSLYEGTFASTEHVFVTGENETCTGGNGVSYDNQNNEDGTDATQESRRCSGVDLSVGSDDNVSALSITALVKSLMTAVDWTRRRTELVMTHLGEVLACRFEGVPLCVVIYKLERLLLHELLKGNSGRLLQDALQDLGAALRLDDSTHHTGSHGYDIAYPESSTPCPGASHMVPVGATAKGSSRKDESLQSSHHPLFSIDI